MGVFLFQILLVRISCQCDFNPFFSSSLSVRKLDWFDEETGKKAERHSKIVILKHMFTLEEIEVIRMIFISPRLACLFNRHFR